MCDRRPASSANAGGFNSVRLTQSELAKRWRISGRTLEKWRQTQAGPRHLKIGGRVVYRLEDIEAFEVEQLRGPA
ncbi:helix-turn-helix transcriptional regulator [Roseomonas fluvialis]|uniref:Helix-turn-helix domain-containing protein n=1 Tax=Roseomonas fluvialis TaxID=1750527 RepID=A0ABM7Y7T5_9PROT|nr:hypothetical protein Rmf_39830 [Roseomonas fluvialis]